MFKFQYKMTSCSGSTATTGITYNGAHFRAAWNTSDFALMEMNNSPLGDARFSWLGWDRSANTPTSGTSIHHPSGDVMKISFDNGSLTENTSQISWSNGTVSPINTHWVVGFDSGTTETGSSGSPLFDQNNRVVGQLHGGSTGCPPVTKYYGQIDTSWTGGGTDATRLSNWLDPCGSGDLTTNTARSPYLSGPSIVCSYSQYTVNNVPPGSTVSWTCSSNISFDNQTGNPKVFTTNGSGFGTIQARLITSCGIVALPAKSVWVGDGSYTLKIFRPDGQPVYRDGEGNPYVCPNTDYFVYIENTDYVSCYPYDLFWDIPSTWTVNYYEGAGVCFNTNNDTYNGVGVDFHSCCMNDIYLSQWFESSPSCYDYLSYSLSFTPNPSSGQTILTIESKDGTKIDESIEWDLEVYDSMQSLKTKTQKLKGDKQTIDTIGWKDGVYIVRVKIGKEIISEKLVVKH